MADFGKLNFSVAFNPVSAFPLDARCYFSSLASAQVAASKAQEVGSTTTVYYYGMQLVVVENNVATWYVIQPDKTLKELGSGSEIDTSNFVKTSQIGSNLEIDDKGMVNVLTTDNAEGDNTRPITSKGTYTIVGNIDTLLGTI